MAGARFLPRWAVADVAGAVVVVDVLRAFTTAAYALAGGARHIVLVRLTTADPMRILRNQTHCSLTCVWRPGTRIGSCVIKRRRRGDRPNCRSGPRARAAGLRMEIRRHHDRASTKLAPWNESRMSSSRNV
jgi:hypothetical protein